MADDKKYFKLKGSAYQLRMLLCVVLAELLVIGAIHLWPVSTQQSENSDIDFAEEGTVLEPVIITRQQSSPPPPPRPQVPIPVPNDQIIEEEVLTLQDFDVSRYADSLFMGTGGEPGNAGEVVANPQSSPRILRIVEPATPDAAQKAGVKTRIWVSFLVDKNGDVEEASISKILIYDEESEEFREVDSINYGLTEVTLDAALQWKFHPATDNGEPVKAYSEQIFTYGF